MTTPTDQPTIVVLDGYTLNPGDLSWDRLEALGDCAVYDRTPPQQVIERCQTAQIVLANKVLLPREAIEALPQLGYIGVLATGTNNVDLVAARELEIPVTNVPVYGTNSVAQMVFAHLLHWTQHVADHATAVRQGRWAAADDFCFWDYPLVELAGLTLGIVGLGRIGRETARLADAFGMQVLASGGSTKKPPQYVRQVELEELLRESDVVSLHCPLTPETQGIINRERLALMKPTAYLINTSRGPLIDEAALAEALQQGKLAGAGLDVLSKEPPPADHPLNKEPGCSITPHIAWATQSARRRLLGLAVDNVEAFLAGNPHNVVNQ